MYLISGYYPDYIKNSYNLTTKINNSIKNGQRASPEIFPKEIHKQTTIITNYHRNVNQSHNEISIISHSIRWLLSKKTENNKCGRECGEIGTLGHSWWECQIIKPLFETAVEFLKKLNIELS